jgi:glycosyltransferase involved in cell wall biosynthesis
MAKTVSSLNCEVMIAGRMIKNSCKPEDIPFNTHRFRMLFKRGFLFYACFNVRLFFFLLFRRYDLLVSNDLDTLLPNYLVSKIKRIPLVYDTHEYFTGVPELAGRNFVIRIWELIEKNIFPKLKNVITVSESIADLYRDKYGIRPLVIRNLGVQATENGAFRREELGIAKEDFLIILQGTGINIDKGAEELVDAVSKTEKTSLIIVGSGDVINNLMMRVKELRLNDRVKFFGPVDRKTLERFTKSADAGVCLEKDTNLNYRYSLPNKLFDYISAGIPVICTDLPESGKIVRDNKCGILLDKITPEKISEAVHILIKDNALYKELKENAEKAFTKLNWDNESILVKELYQNIIGNIGNE